MSETNTELDVLRQRLKDAEQYLKLDELSDRKLELEDIVAQPDLWDDAERAKKVSQELSEITEDINLHNDLTTQLEEVETLSLIHI